jgi:hypothetical protein
MLFIALVLSFQDKEKVADEPVHWLSSGDKI